MKIVELRKGDARMNADFYGNNAAFTCPCGKVFIVSEHIHKKGRECPRCQKHAAFVMDGKAWLESLETSRH